MLLCSADKDTSIYSHWMEFQFWLAINENWILLLQTAGRSPCRDNWVGIWRKSGQKEKNISWVQTGYTQKPLKPQDPLLEQATNNVITWSDVINLDIGIQIHNYGILTTVSKNICFFSLWMGYHCIFPPTRMAWSGHSCFGNPVKGKFGWVYVWCS